MGGGNQPFNALIRRICPHRQNEGIKVDPGNVGELMGRILGGLEDTAHHKMRSA